VPLKPEVRAAYQREYRLRKREQGVQRSISRLTKAAQMTDRIEELEAEVQHLKSELAKRAVVADKQVGIPAPGLARTTTAGFNTRPFTPAPKKGK
jgi:hypothetical protein